MHRYSPQMTNIERELNIFERAQEVDQLLKIITLGYPL